MAYIGRQLARGENKLFDDISSSFNGSTTVFNLTVSSVATATATPYQLFVSLGGVMQKPNTDFTTAGNQITFTTAPAAGLSCWIMMQGDTIDQAAIPDAIVTPSKIANSGDFAFPADVRLKDSDGSHYVGFQAPTTVSTNKVWTLPAADGSASQYLQTNGSGVLSWSSVTIGGASGIDFNDDVKARFGTGNDLEIFHNASNSVINDAGTGDLLLQVGGSTKATVSSTGFDITGALTVSTNATITGNLTVSGTTTTINTQTLDVEDKNVVIGKVSTPSDTTADGGGITLKGASDKTINWINSTDAWTFSEHINIASGKKLGVGGANYGTSGQVLTSGGSSTHPSWTTISAAPEVSATATGAITADKSVCVKSDGTFEQIATTTTINNPATAGSTTYQMHDSMPYDSYPQIATEPDDGFVALSFCAEGSNQGYYKLGKVNATTGAIDWYRTPFGNSWYTTTTTYYTRVTYGKNSAGETIFLFSCINNNNQVVFRAAKVESASVDENGTLAYNLTFGTAATYSGTGDHYEVQFNDADDKFYIVCGSSQGGSQNDKQVIASIAVSSASGFACTIGSDVGGTISGSGGSSIKTVIDPSTNNIFSFIQKSNIVKMIPWTWGGSAYTMGSMSDVVSSIYSSSYKSFDVGFDSKNSKIILCYAHSDEDGRVMIGDVSGASVTWGSHVEYQNANTNGVAIAFDSDANRVFIGARNEGASDNAYIYNGVTSGSGASSTITFTGSNATVSADTTNYYAAAYEPQSGLVIFGYGKDDDNDRGKIVTFNLASVTTNATDENFIGFAKSTVSNGAAVTVKVVGNTTTQSSLTPGQKYYLQMDGTISLTPAGNASGLASTIVGKALTSTSLLITPA